MRNILGLDLGTNSIGWALVQIDENEIINPAIKLGSRIIPMSQDVLGKFDSGVTESQTAVRTSYRGIRRIRERFHLRRERLHRILHILGFLPPHYDKALGWNRTISQTYGKFIDDTEPKLAWTKDPQGKNRFIFMDSFCEMVREFQMHNPKLMADGKRIPMDWTLYYLRHKALQHPISRQELAWILLNFNQKRGYYQLRGEDEIEENKSKKVEYHILKVIDVEDTGEKGKNGTWYNIHLENGWVYRRASKKPLDNWMGLTKEFIVTTEMDEQGNVKQDDEGNEKRTFKAPEEKDWTLQKKRTESSIEVSGLTVGSYIYHHLLEHPNDKIIGKLVRTIDRKFYKKELTAILRKQASFIPELNDTGMLESCIKELYARNEAHQASLRRKDLINLLIEDLIFYQRPLKSKKSLINNCPYEHYEYIDKQTGEIKIQPIKCIAKSNPYYQEFRLWQFIQNLRIYNTEDIEEKDITDIYLKSEDDYVRLFNFLNNRNEIKQETFLKDFLMLKKPKGKECKYTCRWNYVEDKAYPCNETRHAILTALKKAGIPSTWLTEEREYRIWHLLYSVTDRAEIIKALSKWAQQLSLPETFVEAFAKMPTFKNEYGAYSEKAIKKLLSVMRMGSHWHEGLLPANLLLNFQHALENSPIDIKMRMGGRSFASMSDFRALPVWTACYAVYGRHSEAKEAKRWEKPSDITSFLYNFKQHSLRNPIVEQVVLETLRTVRDIWEQYGKIDEVHVELGRSMKSTADQRARMAATIQNNENTNLRIKYLLRELKSDSSIEEVRPHSPMQQDLLRIYEEGALLELKREDPDYEDISRISKLSTPTQSELIRYKLWLEQKYLSPYTGRAISLTKLFTSAYQIEHIIPKVRFYDDSFSNKVICEAEVNQLKSNQLGYEFIQKHGGEIVSCTALGKVRIFTKEEYKAFINEHYASNKTKARKLLMEDIPENFIQRQMNDSRYISKLVTEILSNLVREENEVDVMSKNVIPCTGGITDKLKKDWGLNDVWNTLVSPRFQRMNQLTGSKDFGHWENKDGKLVFQTTMPLELQKGFSKKRIDHRHHAMDALVIALTSRNTIAFLNNVSAQDTQRRNDLKSKLCGKGQTINKPWETFTQDALHALENMVVSFKNNVRVINKTSNFYEHYNENGKKELTLQKGAGQWAVRKSLHKETIYGHVNLRIVKQVNINDALDNAQDIANKSLRKAILTLMAEGKGKAQIKKWLKEHGEKLQGMSGNKIDVYCFSDNDIPMVATRKTLDDSFDEKHIRSITDTGIQRILLAYLEANGNDPKQAFSPEGIERMNQNIELYNNGKRHKPILSVRYAEIQGEKFSVGETGSKSKKYAKAQKGTNLYLGVYEDTEGHRTVYTVPLSMAVERLKQGLNPVPEVSKKGAKLRFWLSPNDLVYVPTEDELLSPNTATLHIKRIYKFVSSEQSQAFFVPHSTASLLMDKKEYKAKNKIELTDDGTKISTNCWKIEVDRLGNITRIIK